MRCMICNKETAVVQDRYRYYCSKCAIESLKNKPAHQKANLKKIKRGQ